MGRPSVIVDIQLNQGSAPWPVLCEAVHAAEAAGFGTVWNLDHFSGSMFGVDSMLECFSVLSAWATMTTRIGVGSLVVNVNNRVPGLLANSAATIQQIAGDRFILGVGAGAAPGGPFSAEHDALGIGLLAPMNARHERFIEVMTEVRGLWSPTRDGRYEGFPRPTKSPPIVVGINSASLAERAGREFDGVNIRWNHPERARLLGLARAACADESRFDVSVWTWFEPELADRSHPLHAELEAEGVTRLVLAVRAAPDAGEIARAGRHLG